MRDSLDRFYFKGCLGKERERFCALRRESKDKAR